MISIEELKKKEKITNEYIDQITKLTKNIEIINEDIKQNIYYEKPIINKLQKLENLSSTKIMIETVNLLDTVFLKLVSKTIKVTDDITIGNKGFVYGKRGYYSYNNTWMPSYTSRYGYVNSNKLNKYKKMLTPDNVQLIKKYVHKKDKKEILDIVSKYIKDIYVSKESDSKIENSIKLSDYKNIFVLISTYNYSIGHSHYQLVEKMFNKITYRIDNEGILLLFYNDLSHTNTLELVKLHKEPRDIFFLNQLLNDDEINIAINNIMNTYIKQQEKKRNVLNQMKYELEPYIVLGEI